MPSPPLIPKAKNDGWLLRLTSQLDPKNLLSCLIIEHLRGETQRTTVFFFKASPGRANTTLAPTPAFLLCLGFFPLLQPAEWIAAHHSPLPVYLQSLPETSNFKDCVLLKSLQRPNTSIRSLSPPTEQAGRHKYLVAFFLFQFPSHPRGSVQVSVEPAVCEVWLVYNLHTPLKLWVNKKL